MRSYSTDAFFFLVLKPLLGKYLLCVMEISGGVLEEVRLNMSLLGWPGCLEEEKGEVFPRVEVAGAKAQEDLKQSPGTEPFSCVEDRRVSVTH